MKKAWDNMEVKFHRECSQRCYGLDDKCALCPKAKPISDRDVNKFLAVLAVCTTVILTVLIIAL